MKKGRPFWPLDEDPEGEVYELASWDMPGRERKAKRKIRDRQTR